MGDEWLEDEATVLSGAQVCTAKNSAVLLASAQHEWTKLNPNSCISATKEEDTVIVTLDVGSLTVFMLRRTRVVAGQNGFVLRSRTGALVFAHVTLVKTGDVHVTVVRGTLEISGGGGSITIQQGESTVITAQESEEKPPEEPPSG